VSGTFGPASYEGTEFPRYDETRSVSNHERADRGGSAFATILMCVNETHDTAKRPERTLCTSRPQDGDAVPVRARPQVLRTP